MSSMKLICSSLSENTVTVLANSLTISGNVNTVAQPGDSATDVAQVQTQSFENPIYNIQGVYFTGESGVMTYADVMELYRLKNDGTGQVKLYVTYGTDTLVGSDGVTTQIPVVLKSFNFPISMSDSKDGYRPTASLTFIEDR